MGLNPITDYYADTPTSNLTENQQIWYDPLLTDIFRRQSVYYSMVQFNMKDLGRVNATEMVIDQTLPMHGNFDPLGMRDIWMQASHFNSQRRRVIFNRYGAKVALHRYDEIVNYWQHGGADADRALAMLLQRGLGQMYVDINDTLIRNAHLQHPYPIIGPAGEHSAITDILDTDLFSDDILWELWLRLGYARGNPMAADPSLPQSNDGVLICFTSPGVIHSLRTSAGNDWISTHQYTGQARLLKYEIGTYRGVRFVQTPSAVLFNCGVQIWQAQPDTDIEAGDGAPDPGVTKVDAVWEVGQQGAGVTHYIQLTAGAINDISPEVSAGDTISIHTDLGGGGEALWTDGTKEDHVLVSVDAVNDRIALREPVRQDFAAATTYVTLGRHVHASIFMAGPDGIVAGVADPPRVHYAAPIDDFGMVHRWSFNQYMGYQLWDSERFDVVLTAGPTHTGIKKTAG